jgi:hypothetical protein
MIAALGKLAAFANAQIYRASSERLAHGTSPLSNSGLLADGKQNGVKSKQRSNLKV